MTDPEMNHDIPASLRKSFEITGEYTCYDYKASVPSLIKLTEDTIIRHTRLMGVDRETIFARDNAYWVLSKYSVNIMRAPSLGETIEIETYPVKPGAAVYDREAVIYKGSEVIGTIASQWCILDGETGRVRRPCSITVYPDFEHLPRKLDPDFCRFVMPEVNEENYVFTYTVGLLDIDFNHHMNNVSYVKLAYTCISPEEYSLGYNSCDVYFRSQCYYGESINVYRKEENGYIFAEGRKQDGKTAFLCRLGRNSK